MAIAWQRTGGKTHRVTISEPEAEPAPWGLWPLRQITRDELLEMFPEPAINGWEDDQVTFTSLDTFRSQPRGLDEAILGFRLIWTGSRTYTQNRRADQAAPRPDGRKPSRTGLFARFADLRKSAQK